MNYSSYYKYSWFADLSYVIWDSLNIANADAIVKASQNAKRIPPNLGTKIFKTDGWKIPSASQGGFYTDDPITGFAANLFVNDQTKEKVLAIRGTEPNTVDILQADLLEIGLIGVALSQAVSLFNYVMRLSSPLSTTANVAQFRVVAGATPAPTNLASNISFSSGGKKSITGLKRQRSRPDLISCILAIT